MQWISVNRPPAARGFYWVVTKPRRAHWSKRYMARMFFDTGYWSRNEWQSEPIYWAEDPPLPGPTKQTKHKPSPKE